MSHETNEVPINPVRPMNAPAGLDLRPKPPSSVRVSKRAGIAVSCLLAVILAGFAYGGYKRQVRQQRVEAEGGPKNVTPATAAGTEILKDIPAAGVMTTGVTVGQDTTELQPPADTRSGNAGASRNPVVVRQPRSAPVNPQQIQRTEPTFEERLVMQAYQREQQAMFAPTAVGQQSSWGGAANPRALPSGPNSVEDLARSCARPVSRFAWSRIGS